MSGVCLLIFLPCHGQKSAPRRGPLIGVNGEGKWAGSLCSVFTVPRAEISSPQRPAHLPSPVRAKERGACAVFTAPRAESSSPERAAHLPSMARANERGPFGQLLLCHGQKISTPERPAHLPSYVRANERGLFAQFLSCPGQKSAPRRGPLICRHR